MNGIVNKLAESGININVDNIFSITTADGTYGNNNEYERMSHYPYITGIDVPNIYSIIAFAGQVDDTGYYDWTALNSYGVFMGEVTFSTKKITQKFVFVGSSSCEWRIGSDGTRDTLEFTPFEVGDRRTLGCCIIYLKS